MKLDTKSASCNFLIVVDTGVRKANCRDEHRLTRDMFSLQCTISFLRNIPLIYIYIYLHNTIGCSSVSEDYRGVRKKASEKTLEAWETRGKPACLSDFFSSTGSPHLRLIHLRSILKLFFCQGK